jgi:heme/copper-type cytochrome/quinol oxidase subunit 1
MSEPSRCAAYQGNAWWILMGLLSLLLFSFFLLEVRRKRKIGMPVDAEEIITASIFCLGFLAVAIFQVLTH